MSETRDDESRKYDQLTGKTVVHGPQRVFFFFFFYYNIITLLFDNYLLRRCLS